MKAPTARVLLVVVIALAIAGVLVARRSTDGEAVGTAGTADAAALPVLADAAPLVQASGWLNSPPLGATELAGKVVLYDFWTFGCTNCRNTLPHVKAWHARYAADGLVVLSIHTPEFAFEADPGAVADFVREKGITYPVALDPDKRTWRAFANRYWPAFYLHDDEGRRRYIRIGEGRYDETEAAIRALLGVSPEAPMAEVGT
jgi:thiol-disulfide isomerase/thioredoxin